MNGAAKNVRAPKTKHASISLQEQKKIQMRCYFIDIDRISVSKSMVPPKDKINGAP